ncbi:beta/gamma crystallin family protein [Desulfovibrio sp. JY]|nr:beta/gamma crystallin family protein [Desulfovibrio sp. JY]
MKRAYLNGYIAMALFTMVAGLCVLIPNKSEAKRCAAIIYEHIDYGGSRQCLQEGSYNVDDLDIGNDMLSSIKVRDGNTVYLFEHKNYSGRRATVTSNHRYVGDRWNDITSSIIVE